MSHQSNKFLIIIFTLIMGVSALLLFYGYHDIKNIHIQAREIIGEQQAKYRYLTTMHTVARERSLVLLRMYAEQDPFELDDLNQELGELARTFIKARNQLLQLDLSAAEKTLLDEQNEVTKVNAPVQNMVAQLFLTDKRQQAEQFLFVTAIPGQNMLLQKINETLALYDKNTIRAAANIDLNFKKASRNFIMLSISLLLTNALFIVFIFHVTRREQDKLQLLLADQTRISAQLDIAAERLTYQASHDGLTELVNRAEFDRRLTQLLQRTEQGTHHVVLYLDLDQFKIVNDTCGHIAGDELLRGIASLMQTYIRKSDVLARLGGDEFGIILEYSELSLAEKVAQSIIQGVNDFRFRWDDKTFRIGVSIGIVIIDDGKTLLDDVLKQADSACYAAKDAGRNRYHLYIDGDKELIKRESEMDWVRQLENAADDDRLILYAQPIVPIKNEHDQKIKPHDKLSSKQTYLQRCNYEILIRMKTKDGSLVPPGAFLPAAERYNKMVRIDRWVVSQSVTMLAAHPDFLEDIDYCAINLSCQSLTDEKFLDFIVDLFSKHSKLAEKICLEITETAAIINLLQANRCISILRGMGVRFALDDFGSGLSSFAYLKTLPIDYLKIDGMFVRDIVNDPIDRAMVKSIHEIATVMGKKTIAEFVENDEILAELGKIGVAYAQGYGIGKPVPFEQILSGKSYSLVANS
jgi:diguanylate cyclase (GGDEF)-like protein